MLHNAGDVSRLTKNGVGNLPNGGCLMSVVGMAVPGSLHLKSVFSKERKLQCSICFLGRW